ncbi:protein adenylyltransferase SelO [Gemmobacter denitrificans]|uniref:Protein nucleotidyltransferase YdiU n=1 Tax=Gemmobacter denitrificans TaxID=3123040 RepID=A0ABU8BSW6_9RHOB
MGDLARAGFRFDNSYRRDLPGAWLDQAPRRVPAPRLLAFNRALATDLGLDPDLLEPDAAEVFSGNRLPPGAEPLAQAYAGHQFGGFSPQLGDGRALLLGEQIDPQGQRRDIALKGSGPTPFSRGGDGFAAVGPVLREYLMGEAMAALGVPTSRALAAVATGAQVARERALPGAVLTRVAASHIRIGTFQFFAARRQTDLLRKLADHAIARHHPAAAQADNPYLALFEAVRGAQVRLVAQWMGLGFIHGVMNTDNMTISGETIDYGPCAFMEAYAPGTVFSSIDRGGRYAYANQPLILGWNLARLAETLLPLFDDDADRAVDLANERLEAVEPLFHDAWLEVMRAKLGLTGQDAGDRALAEGFLQALEGTDWTQGFRALADAAEGGGPGLVFERGALLADWLGRWRVRLGGNAAMAAQAIRATNPIYIPRNQRVEEALTAAEEGDIAPFQKLLAVLADPFTNRPGQEAFALPAPQAFMSGFRTFCGT